MIKTTPDGVLLDLSAIEQFATASGDRNPLHTDPRAARATPFGRIIAHGTLVALIGIGHLPAAVLSRARRLAMTFSRPVYPGTVCRVATTTTNDMARARIECHGETAATVTVHLEAVDRVAVRQFGNLESYEPDISALRRLTARLTPTEVPIRLLALLAWASWLAGMQMPNQDSTLVDLTLDVDTNTRPDGQSWCRVDERVTQAHLIAGYLGPAGGGTAMVHAFMRPSIPPPTRISIAKYVQPGMRLRGKNILVVGGSRGLGAAVVGAMASQNATIWAAYAGSDTRALAVRDEFGANRVIPIRCDARDQRQVQAAMERISDAVEGLDGIVLVAAPVAPPLAVHPDAVDFAVDYVSETLAMVVTPLAEALPLLNRRSSWLVAISSASLTTTPPGHSHYCAAKSAVEGYVSYYAHNYGLSALVLRAPKMWTTAVNHPMGRLGTVPVETVAATILDWVTMDRTAAAYPATTLMALPPSENPSGDSR